MAERVYGCRTEGCKYEGCTDVVSPRQCCGKAVWPEVRCNGCGNEAQYVELGQEHADG